MWFQIKNIEESDSRFHLFEVKFKLKARLSNASTNS